MKFVDDPVLDAIAHRRSVSKVGPNTPSDEEIATLLAAVTHVADHKALRPWRLILLRGEDRLTLARALDAAQGIEREPGEVNPKPFRAELLIALVASIARQARGSYTMEERRRWMGLVLAMGGLAFVLGLILLFTLRGEAISFVGFVLIGLALICWSISSKVILLAKIWHADFPLANRIPIIPVLTALACLFLAAFLYEAALSEPKYFVPARVLTGFGAICFTLYSIVSILESGASKK